MFWFKKDPLSHLSQWEQDIIAHLKCYKLESILEGTEATIIDFTAQTLTAPHALSDKMKIKFKHYTREYDREVFDKKTMESELWVVQISTALFNEVLKLAKTTMIASIKPAYQWDKELKETFEDMQAIQDAANNINSLTRSVQQIQSKPR